VSLWHWKRRRDDGRKTEAELTKLENFLREEMKAFVRKLRFIEEQAVVKFDDNTEEAVLNHEDKMALANDGIDAVVKQFSEYMRTRVKSDGTED